MYENIQRNLNKIKLNLRLIAHFVTHCLTVKLFLVICFITTLTKKLKTI